MEDNYLFDASSLIYALKLKNIDTLHGNYIQYLTLYEIINSIWKETYLIKSISVEEANQLIEVVAEILDYLKILSIHPYEAEILMKAIDLGLTAYDTSYIVLAEKNNLVLVTEDKKLREKAGETIKTMSLRKLIE